MSLGADAGARGEPAIAKSVAAPADSVGAAADSVAAPVPTTAPAPILRPHQLQEIPPRLPVRADSVPARRKPSRFEQPRWVMARSLLIPGWGQLHNRSWIKAAGIAAGELWLGYRLIDDKKKLRRLEEQVVEARAAGNEDRELDLVDAYNSRLDGYVSRQWVLGGLVSFALLDAYIDAHFRGFGVEFEGDPALPGGTGGGGGLRISVRSAF